MLRTTPAHSLAFARYRMDVSAPVTRMVETTRIGAAVEQPTLNIWTTETSKKTPNEPKSSKK